MHKFTLIFPQTQSHHIRPFLLNRINCYEINDIHSNSVFAYATKNKVKEFYLLLNLIIILHVF
jgi:hypothetical protein